MKKAASSSRSIGSTPHRLGRRAIQYLLVFIGCVVFVDALVGERGLLETVKKREEYRRLEQSIRRLHVENARLREEVGLLNNDPATIEEHARRDLGLIKPGEKLFIIRDVTPANPRGSAEDD